MRPEDFTPESMKDAQVVLKNYSRIYPSEKDRKLFPELVQAIQHCKAWDITTDDIIEAITISTSHPFWADVLAKGSLTGFIKPRHIEAVRQYTPEATDNIEHNRRRWEAEDEKRRQQQHARGLDENGKPLLRVAVQ